MKRGLFVNIILFLCIILFSIPIQYLAYDVYSSCLRDNLNYYKAFVDMEGSGVVDGFLYFRLATGASEPVLYLYFKLCSLIGVGYTQAILIANVTFISSLSLFVVRLGLKPVYYICALVFFSFDFYIFVLSGDIHRLKLALSLLFIALAIKNKFVYLVSFFTHFQTILLLPLFTNVSNFIRKYVIIVFAFVCIISPFIYQKVIFYFANSNGLVSLSYYLILFTLFILIIPLLLRGKVPKNTLFFYVSAFVPVIIFGHERINIFLLDGAYISMLIYCSRYINDIKSKVICCSLTLVFVIYNVGRIYSLYADLMYSSVLL